MRAHTLHKGEQAIAIDCTPQRVTVDIGGYRYMPEWRSDDELQTGTTPGIPEFVAFGDGYVIFDKPADENISVFVE